MNMESIKRVVISLVLVSILAITSGCHEKTETNEVVIYSTHGGSAAKVEFITTRAKEELGIDVIFVSGGGGTLKDRLILEKENPQADVVMALYQLFMYELKDEGVLEAYTPSWSGSIKPQHHDPDGYFWGLGNTPIVIAYNTDFIDAKDAPTSWEELFTEKYANMYSIGSIENQTSRLLLSCLLWKNRNESGDPNWALIEDMYKYAAVTKNEQFSWASVKNGDIPIVTEWYGGAKSAAANYEIPLAYVEIAEGTPIAIESIALINGGKNSDAAKRFIDWFGSAQVMADYAKEFFYEGQCPVNEDALALCSTEIQEHSAYFKEYPVDWSQLAKHSIDWISYIQMNIAY